MSRLYRSTALRSWAALVSMIAGLAMMPACDAPATDGGDGEALPPGVETSTTGRTHTTPRGPEEGAQATEDDPEQERSDATRTAEDGGRHALEVMQERHREAAAILREVASLVRRGEFDAAQDRIDASLELRPGYAQASAMRAEVLRAQGRSEEAVDYITAILADAEAGRRTKGDRELLVREKATSQLASGDLDGALVTVDGLIATDDGPRLRERYLRAQILAARKDADATVAALEEAVERGYLGGQKLRADEAFAFLAGDERFEAILRQLDAKLATSQRRAAEFLASGGAEGDAREGTSGDSSKSGVGGSGLDGDLPEFTRSEHSESCLVYLDGNLKRGTGKAVGELETVTLDGEREFRLSSFATRPAIVLFWGMWSEVGRRQVERLHEATREHREGAELEVVLVHYADPASKADDPHLEAQEWLEGKGIASPCARASKSQWKELGVPVFPATYFLDGEGRAALVLYGPIEAELLGKIADRLVDGAESESEE